MVELDGVDAFDGAGTFNGVNTSAVTFNGATPGGLVILRGVGIETLR